MNERKWISTNSFKTFRSREVQNGNFRVLINKGNFECSLSKKTGSKNLFVVMSGSRDPEKNKWPFFQHQEWKEKLNGHVLYVADPTLFHAKELRIGWYVGTAEYDWLDAMKKLVERVAESLHIDSKNIYPIGETSGGFAALMLASKLNGATAIAINPHTQVFAYYKRFVSDLLESCFDGIIASRVPASLKPRFSATTAYQDNIFAKAVILQNQQSQHHYMKHFLPFCEALNLPKDGGIDSMGRIHTILLDGTETSTTTASMLPVLQQHAEQLAR